MSTIEIAIRYSQRLEGILERRFGARGRGLHEKLTSVETRLPTDIVRSLRWVATMRNSAVHEEGFQIKDIEDFTRTCEHLIQRLESLPLSPPDVAGAIPTPGYSTAVGNSAVTLPKFLIVSGIIVSGFIVLVVAAIFFFSFLHIRNAADRLQRGGDLVGAEPPADHGLVTLVAPVPMAPDTTAQPTKTGTIARDPVSALGFEIGRSTLDQVKEQLATQTSVEDAGTNKYSHGPMLRTYADAYDIEGLVSVVHIFDKDQKLAAVVMTMGKGEFGDAPGKRFDEVLRILQEKYQLKAKQRPYVGDMYARLKAKNVVIELDAPHLSSEMEARYIRDDLFGQMNAQKEQEKKQKEDREKSRF